VVYLDSPVLPSDHFGIVVLMNADEKMEAMDILTKSIDEVFETKRGETSIRNPLIPPPASENIPGPNTARSL